MSLRPYLSVHPHHLLVSHPTTPSSRLPPHRSPDDLSPSSHPLLLPARPPVPRPLHYRSELMVISRQSQALSPTVARSVRLCCPHLLVFGLHWWSHLSHPISTSTSSLQLLNLIPRRRRSDQMSVLFSAYHARPCLISFETRPGPYHHLSS